jgi:hypothetical protein
VSSGCKAGCQQRDPTYYANCISHSLLSPIELSRRSLARVSLLDVELDRCRSTSALVDTGSRAEDAVAGKRDCSELAGLISYSAVYVHDYSLLVGGMSLLSHNGEYRAKTLSIANQKTSGAL